MVLTKRQEVVDLISHELKTPTVPIEGYCEMLLNIKFGVLNGDQTDAVKEIMNNIHKLQTFLDEIIETERKNTDESSKILPRGLKVPLIPILGYCELLESKKFGDLDEFQTDAVKEIHQNAIQLNNLINDFWNAQQIEIGEMKYLYEETEVDEFIDNIVKDFSYMMKDKNIKFSKKIEPNLKIRTDRSKLREIFEKLLDNAKEFVPENTGEIEIQAISEDGFVRFSVIDNGIGIEIDKMPTLFKKFHQIDTSHRRSHFGSGLGLTISKGYIEAMGGKMGVESKVGEGTKFFFTNKKADES